MDQPRMPFLFQSRLMNLTITTNGSTNWKHHDQTDSDDLISIVYVFSAGSF